tara:strand:- start:414 stop:836 length:423 start_codon:yes stop_codon:yes gene_type:complete
MNNNIYTSGGIVRKKNKILFILKRDKWDFPKGKIKSNQKKSDAALLEIYEETNLPIESLKIIGKLPSTSYFKIIKGEKYLKKTFWYEVEYQGSMEHKLIPDEKESITECRWFDISNLSEVFDNTHMRIKYLLDFYLEQIK